MKDNIQSFYIGYITAMLNVNAVLKLPEVTIKEMAHQAVSQKYQIPLEEVSNFIKLNK